MYLGDSFNDSTIFTIDDLGVMRLIGTYKKGNQRDKESFETKVTQFKTANKYVYAESELNVKFLDKYGPLQNDNGWVYIVKTGQLDLYYKED